MKFLPKARVLALLMLPALASGAADWPQFRGPSSCGASPETGLPTRLDPSRHIAWKVALPGRGLSSPVVTGGRLFLTCASGPRQDRLHVFCFRTSDGKKLWERQFWATGRTMTQSKTCVAAPSPATDGKRIFALFSSNDIFCLDLEGNLLWLRGLTRDYPNASNSLGMASSLLVVGDVVIAQIENDSESFAAGLDAATGANRWKIERPKSANWASPVLLGDAAGGGALVALQSGKGVQLVEAASGKAAGSYDEAAATIPSSCTAGGVLFVPSGGITALKPQGAGRPIQKLWQAPAYRPATASPLVVGERLYVVSGPGTLNCADVKTGDRIWQLKLKGPFSASPVAAANHAYFVNEKGAIQVVDIRADAKAGVLVGGMTLEAGILSTPAIADRALFIRNDGALWKIAGEDAPAAVRIRRFVPEPPICRAGRPVGLLATVENAGTGDALVRAELVAPRGCRIAGADFDAPVALGPGEARDLRWTVHGEAAGRAEFHLRLEGGAADAALPVDFLPPVEVRKTAYIPDPAPVKTELLIGAHHCPLWESDKPDMWANVLKHPERTPALGFYSQENPEVSDWETKWAVEHGISFFIYCWYRSSQGGPVTTRFGSAIHDALFKSRFADRMQFTIMWENQSRGQAGVADEADLMNNLMPFWIQNYFRHPSYLKVDRKPVLFIYRPEFLVDDLGGEANVRAAFEKMRAACRDAGFDGLHILGEYRGTDPKHLNLLKRLGLDYSFAYCWHVPNSPTPEEAIRAQMESIAKTQQLGILPQVVTVSQAWSGWRDEGSIWKIPPREFEAFLRKARDFIAAIPDGQLGRRMLLLDNWNEWGEGHYIAPYREYGFGYLDAVRNVFAPDAGPHSDLIPEDVGMGPYDTAIRAQLAERERLRRLREAFATKAAPPEPGLVGWWAFDEEKDAPVVLDYSGGRRGGDVHGAGRAAGIDGSALVCTGGCASVAAHPSLSVTGAITLAAWIKTDVADQKNQWFVNRVFSGGTDTGYRLGVLDGAPCFEIPVTSFSHHLKAAVKVATNRWTHVAGTFDGQTMRIYVDGAESGSMPRPGAIKANQFPVCLGNFDRGHEAHFTGLLDEVKLYDRALAPDEIARQAAAIGRDR